MYSKVEISNIVVRGVKVKKSEIRLKSENLHPCLWHQCSFSDLISDLTVILLATLCIVKLRLYYSKSHQVCPFIVENTFITPH